MLDIRVVQAAATIIPTLLIAAVFTTKIYERTSEWQGKGLRVGLVIALFFVALIGEMSAIRLLANTRGNDSPEANLTAVVIGTVFVELILLSGLAVAEVTTQTGNRRFVIAGWLILVPAVVIAAIICAGIDY